MFKRVSGQPNMIMMPIVASTVMVNGGTLALDSTTGYLTVGASTSPSIFGVIQSAIASTDPDYATAAKLKLVDIGGTDVIWQVDVNNGGSTAFSATDVGQFFKVSAVDASGIDCNTRSSTPGQGFTAQGLVFLCVGFIQATVLTSNTSSYDGIGLFKIMSLSAVRPASS